jgi:MoaA/NifB/PqqE/SkfB family radical SAM enzyme
MPDECYLAGSPYHVEDVLGYDLYERAQEGILTHLLLNQPPICDCHCRRCFMPESRRGRCENALNTTEYCRVVREAASAGILCLEISGEGEPLLSSHLRDIIQCASDYGLVTTLITNGHSLSEEFIRFASERNVTLVVSLFSLNAGQYEMDNRLPGSFESTLRSLEKASIAYKDTRTCIDGRMVYRMAIHTTAQADNVDDLRTIRSFCEEQGIFFSIAPLAPVGGGMKLGKMMLSEPESDRVCMEGHNSIILSRTSRTEVGREVCGTCLYGLNIGYDGNLLFDAHAGYEIGDVLGNIRRQSLHELIRRQRRFVPTMFQRIDGFCPVRDRKWPLFLAEFTEEQGRTRHSTRVAPQSACD